MKKIYLIIFSVLLIASGCNRDSVVDPNNIITNPFTKKGLYILSEGSFSPGTSNLSFYDFDTMYYDNIFKPGNIGLFPDGLIYDGKNLFLTEQGTYGGQGKIYKLDTGGTVINSSIVGVNPYSLCIVNSKIYITNMNGDIRVHSKENFAFLKSIVSGINPQEILYHNGKVFVCNYGGYNSVPDDSTVSVIDVQKDSVINRITLIKSPSSIAVTNDNKLLVGCEGANGKIYLIDPSTYIKLDSFSIVGGFSRDISVDKTSNDVYFISNTLNIVKLNLITKQTQTIINNPTPSSNYFYGYIFDSKRQNHYVANARNFTTNGIIHKYDVNGTLLLSFTTAIAPRRFLILGD